MENRAMKLRNRAQRPAKSRQGGKPIGTENSGYKSALMSRRISQGSVPAMGAPPKGSRPKIAKVFSSSNIAAMSQGLGRPSPLCALRAAQSLITLPSLRGSTAIAGVWTDPDIVPFNEGPVGMRSVTVHMRSTWCDSGRISVSGINVLDERMVPIQAAAISALPEECVPGVLEIVRPPMIKSEAMPKWEAPFDGSVWVRIWVAGDAELHSLRMWNIQSKDGPGLKDFDVFVGDLFACSRTLEPTLGQILSLNTQVAREAVDRNRFGDIEEPPGAHRVLRDQFGILPVGEAESVEIVMVNSHNRSCEVGLNAIQFFGWDDELIELPDAAGITLTNILSHKSMRNLCNCDPHRVDPDKMWRGTITAPPGQIATMKVSFGIRVPLKRVRIYNYNAPDYRLGLSNAGLRVDGRTVWLGKIKQAIGRNVDIDEFATDIFTHDVPAQCIFP